MYYFSFLDLPDLVLGLGRGREQDQEAGLGPSPRLCPLRRHQRGHPLNGRQGHHLRGHRLHLSKKLDICVMLTVLLSFVHGICDLLYV